MLEVKLPLHLVPPLIAIGIYTHSTYPNLKKELVLLLVLRLTPLRPFLVALSCAPFSCGWMCGDGLESADAPEGFVSFSFKMRAF